MTDRAGRLLEFLPTVITTQGEGAGDAFNVLPWEGKFCSGAFQDGIYQASLTIARGNGKSTFTAAIAAAHLGPLRQERAEIICVASSFLQATIIFEHVLGFLRPEIEAFPKDWQVRDSQNVASLQHKRSRARVRCIGSDPKRAHGLAPVLVLADEPAQWPANTAEKMFAALKTSLGKIPHSKLIALGTLSDNPMHFFNRRFEGQQAGYHQKHAAARDCDVSDRASWTIANPSLPYMPSLQALLESEYEESLQDPALMAAFKALRLNMGVSDTSEQMLLDAGIWESIEDDDLEADGRPVWGVDLGSGASMSAVAAYYPNGVLKVIAAFPGRPGLNDRGLRDGVGDLYAKMMQRGELLLCGDMVTDIGDLLTEALAHFGQPVAIVADRWREKELIQFLTNSHFPVCTMVTRGMGFKDGSEDVRLFRRAALDGHVSPRVSLLMRSAMASARTVSDPAGNSKLSKSTQGGRRLNARDDAAAAAILAVGEMVRNKESGAQRSLIYYGIAH